MHYNCEGDSMTEKLYELDSYIRSFTAAVEECLPHNDGYAVRLRGKQSDSFQKNLDQLKETFSGVKIEVK